MLLDITQVPKATYYKKLKKLLTTQARHYRVGFWGQPDQGTMDLFRGAGYAFVDLDISLEDLSVPSFVPQTTCHIIQDILANAYYQKDQLDFFLAATGPDKCDQGRNVADLLTMEGLPVINASNINTEPFRPPLISEAALPLAERVKRIMELTYLPLRPEEIAYYQAHQMTKPRFVFHGVPPRDLSLLDNFPPDTRIAGWVRMVELGIPGRVDLEWQLTDSLPTVFFTQSFCHKELLASFLAKKVRGFHIEAHGTVTNSTEAKLQAYLGLAGVTFLPKEESQ